MWRSGAHREKRRKTMKRSRKWRRNHGNSHTLASSRILSPFHRVLCSNVVVLYVVSFIWKCVRLESASIHRPKSWWWQYLEREWKRKHTFSASPLPISTTHRPNRVTGDDDNSITCPFLTFIVNCFFMCMGNLTGVFMFLFITSQNSPF